MPSAANGTEEVASPAPPSPAEEKLKENDSGSGSAANASSKTTGSSLSVPLLQSNGTAAPPQTAAPGFFDSLLSSVNNTFTDLSSQATNAVGDLGNNIVNLSTHATKLSTSLAAAEEQWREFFPIAASESSEEEKLLNFFFCNLLTSIGPCPGTLFVSDHSLYFVSDQELEFNVDPEEVDESQYRVSIPLNCVSGMAPKMNPTNEVDRYIQVVTADHFDFWFTGFLHYDSAFAHLLAALHDAGRLTESLLRNAE